MHTFSNTFSTQINSANGLIFFFVCFPAPRNHYSNLVVSKVLPMQGNFIHISNNLSRTVSAD